MLSAAAASFHAGLATWSRAWQSYYPVPPRIHPPAPVVFEKVPGTPDDVQPGFEVSATRTFTDADVEAFVDACGDANPLHLDDDYASQTPFKGRIVHGLLSAALISTALAKLPGVVVYVSQHLAFVRPVRPGDTVTARVRVVERAEGKRKVRLSTVCEIEGGERVVEGEAVVLILPEPARE